MRLALTLIMLLLTREANAASTNLNVQVVPASAPTITVNGSSTGVTVPASTAVTVAVSNGPKNPRDWIGMCTDTSTCNTWSDWKYLANCSQTPPTSGAASNSCSLTVSNAAGKYYAAFFPNDLHSGILGSVPVSVISVGATACNDADHASGIIPPGWACDPLWSDDFNGTGGFDTGKWRFRSEAECSTTTIDRSTNAVYQSGGVIHNLITSNGTTSTMPGIWGQSGAKSGATGGYPFFDWYREVAFQLTTTGSLPANLDLPFITEWGYVKPTTYAGWDYAELELDTPEAQQINMFYWGLTKTTYGLLYSEHINTSPPWAGGSIWNNGPHWVGLMKQSSTFTVWVDGTNIGVVPNMPAETVNLHGSVSFDFTADGYICPIPSGTADLQILYEHVHH